MKQTRVFMTGFGPAQCRPEKTHMKIWSPTGAVQTGLTMLGYEVTRKIGFGVTPDDFDVLGVTPGNWGSITSDYGAHAMILMYQTLAEGKPVFTIVEDWQYPKFVPAFRRLAATDKDRVTKWMNHKIRSRGEGRLGYAHIRDHQAHIIREIAVMLSTGQWPNPIMAVLPWYDGLAAAAAIRTTPDKMHFVDPSALYPVWPKPIADSRRRREWILATLYDFRPWANSLNLTWPIRCFGKKVGGKNILESEVAQEYAHSWGNLSPENQWSNIGICKDRYIHSARAWGILLPGTVMANKIGYPYKFLLEAIEETSDFNLNVLANHQADMFFDLSWSRDRFLGALEAIMADIGTCPQWTGRAAW